MTPEAVQALARVALLELSQDEAAAIAAGLAPVVALIEALPAAPAEPAPAPARRSALRADVPGPTFSQAQALAGVPVVAEGLVQAARFREDA